MSGAFTIPRGVIREYIPTARNFRVARWARAVRDDEGRRPSTTVSVVRLPIKPAEVRVIAGGLKFARGERLPRAVKIPSDFYL